MELRKVISDRTAVFCHMPHEIPDSNSASSGHHAKPSTPIPTIAKSTQRPKEDEFNKIEICIFPDKDEESARGQTSDLASLEESDLERVTQAEGHEKAERGVVANHQSPVQESEERPVTALKQPLEMKHTTVTTATYPTTTMATRDTYNPKPLRKGNLGISCRGFCGMSCLLCCPACIFLVVLLIATLAKLLPLLEDPLGETEGGEEDYDDYDYQ